MAETPAPSWLEVGRIVAPQGLDGSVRVYPDSDFPERFLAPGPRWLRKPGQQAPDCVQLLSGRYLQGKGLYVIKLAGVESREQAEALREARLLVPAGDRLPIEPDEFHVADLIGLEVRLQKTGVAIGTVTDVYSAGNDLLAVAINQEALPDNTENNRSDASASRRKAKPSPQPVLVPFVHEIVPVVDLEAGYVELDPPKGLLPEL